MKHLGGIWILPGRLLRLGAKVLFNKLSMDKAKGCYTLNVDTSMELPSWCSFLYIALSQVTQPFGHLDNFLISCMIRVLSVKLS